MVRCTSIWWFVKAKTARVYGDNIELQKKPSPNTLETTMSVASDDGSVVTREILLEFGHIDLKLK